MLNQQLDRFDHSQLKSTFGLPRRTHACKFYAAVDLRRVTTALLDKKATLLYNLTKYNLTNNIINDIVAEYNKSSNKTNYKGSWIHEL